MSLKMLEEGIDSIGVVEDPFIQCIGVYFTAKRFFELFLLLALKDDFGRFKTLQ